MSELYLSPEEIHGLTHLVRPAAQARFLEAMGIPTRRRPDGTLLVLRRDLEGGTRAAPAPARPNLDAIRRPGPAGGRRGT